MFIGHFAIGFASKRIAPRASLATLLAAPLFLDLLWPICLLLGIEQVHIGEPGGNPFLTTTFTSYPWSHSLVMSLVWGALFGGTYYAVTRQKRVAWVLALAVVSHWVLDYVTHVPDLPVATIVVELAMFVVGVWLYAAGTTARDGIGRYAWWALVVLSAASYVGSLFSPAPPSVTALAWTAIAGSAVTVWLAWWADRHRTANDG
jgi:hypothetical protein